MAELTKGDIIDACPLCQQEEYHNHHHAEEVFRVAYQRGLAEGRKLGREEERDLTLHWMRTLHPSGILLGRRVAEDFASWRADHLRPDIKDEEGESNG